MTFTQFVQSDFFCSVLCLVFCLIHSVIAVVSSRKTGKKLSALCDKCGLPLAEDVVHDCALSSTQLKALTAFVAALKQDKE